MPQPRKSVSEHRLNGTFRADRHHDLAPAPAVVGGRPPIPKHLVGPARQEYRRICGLLEKRGHLTAGDYYAAAALAEITTRWIQAKRILDERGLTITVSWLDKLGNERQTEKLNPLTNAVAALESQILRYCKALGLSPDSRSKVEPAAAPPAPEGTDLTFEQWQKLQETKRAN